MPDGKGSNGVAARPRFGSAVNPDPSGTGRLGRRSAAKGDSAPEKPEKPARRRKNHATTDAAEAFPDSAEALRAELAAARREIRELQDRLRRSEQTADYDVLLPILNRRAFVRELSRVISYANRYRAPASVVYLDLNDFKRINDEHGHAAGDCALKHIADLLVDQIRESDSVGRLGGDEFALILAQADAEQAERKARRLADHIARHPARFETLTLPIGFSYGIHCLERGDDAESAIARADEAMYVAKMAQRRGAGAKP